MRNNQPAEKQTEDGMVLQVNSIFHTLQGEGPCAGMPAVFVRLAGCNLQCPECDTEYSKRRFLPLSAILLEMAEARGDSPTKLAVITGGEPFRQPLRPFINALRLKGWVVQIETNGTLFQELPYDDIMVVCSPKTGSINKLLVPHLTALKYVVDERLLGSDGFPDRALWNGKSTLPRPPRNFAGQIFLQPYDSGDTEENKKHQAAAVAACFKTGGSYCHQLHKLLNLE